MLCSINGKLFMVPLRDYNLELYKQFNLPLPHLHNANDFATILNYASSLSKSFVRLPLENRPKQIEKQFRKIWVW